MFKPHWVWWKLQLKASPWVLSGKSLNLLSVSEWVSQAVSASRSREKQHARVAVYIEVTAGEFIEWGEQQ